MILKLISFNRVELKAGMVYFLIAKKNPHMIKYEDFFISDINV